MFAYMLWTILVQDCGFSNQSLHECCYAATVSGLEYECFRISIYELTNRYFEHFLPFVHRVFFVFSFRNGVSISIISFSFPSSSTSFKACCSLLVLLYISRLLSFARYFYVPAMYLLSLNLNHLFLQSLFLNFLLFMFNSSHTSNGALMFFNVIPNWIQVLYLSIFSLNMHSHNCRTILLSNGAFGSFTVGARGSGLHIMLTWSSGSFGIPFTNLSLLFPI